jgi:ABC-type branched-subunit amino acid transport system ATPase component
LISTQCAIRDRYGDHYNIYIATTRFMGLPPTKQANTLAYFPKV